MTDKPLAIFRGLPPFLPFSADLAAFFTGSTPNLSCFPLYSDLDGLDIGACQPDRTAEQIPLRARPEGA